MRLKFLLTTVSFCLCFLPDSSAQLIVRKKASENEPAPTAILVQLNANTRKKEAFIRSNNQSLLKQINADTDSIIKKMMTDFEDNFSYCPVYYFIDTNAELVKKQQFSGILLNKDFRPADNIPFKPNDNYFIVSYGLPIASLKKADALQKNDPYATDQNYTGKKRLVVMDKTMTLLPKPLPDGSNNIKGGAMKKAASAYKYASPKFDIYYRPSAKNFSAKLNSFYGPYPYK